MTATHTRTKFVTAAVGAASPPWPHPHCCFSAREPRKPSSTYLPTPRTCSGCEGFNPQPDSAGDPDPSIKVGLGGPDTKVGVGTPGGASPSLNPGDTVGIIIIGG